MATKKETTDAGVVGSLQRLEAKLAANSADLPHLEAPRAQMRSMLARFEELGKQQSAMRASKQEASKEMRTIITESQRMGNGLRRMVQIHYGIRSEKLIEFDLQPFRGRKVKEPAQETPATNPVSAA